MAHHLSLALLVLVVQGASPRFQVASLSIELLEGVTVTTRNPVEDFTLYNFKSAAGRDVLGAYAGFHPSVGEAAPKTAKRSKISINGISGERLSWRDDQGRTSVEILLSPDKSSRVHLWYASASDLDVKLAEALIASIRR
jgi:hypothetical protein